MFLRIIPEPIIDNIHFLILLPIILSPASTRMSLFFLVHALFNSSKNESANDVVSGIIGEPDIDKRVINPPNGTIFDN